MGLIHNELRRSKLSEALTRALGASKGAPGIERFGETLTPTIDLWSQPEWAFLRNERLGATVHVKAAVAGEFGIIGIVNPATSNRIVVVEVAGVTTTVAGTTFLEAATEAQMNALTAAAQQVGSTRDRRGGTDTATQTIAGSAVAQTTGGRQVDRALSTTAGNPGLFTVALPHVLPPGQALAIVGRIANEIVIAFFGFRERQALPGELV